MNKIILVSLVTILMFPFVAAAESIEYTNQQNHYTFTIPDGWAEVPKASIDQVFQQVAEQTGSQFVDYSAGFQLEGVPVLQYPYILVQEYAVDTPSFNEIQKSFDSYPESISDSSVDEPFIDRNRGIVFINSEANIANVGAVSGLTAIFLGKESITQLNFFTLKSEAAENQSTLNQIIDSFRYHKGYEYAPEKAKKNDPPSIFEGVFELGIVGGLAALLLVLLVRFKRNKQQR